MTDPNGFEECIRPFLAGLKPTETVLFRSEIPDKKLRGAIEAYAPSTDGGSMLALCDTTVFKTISEGFLITATDFYFKDKGEPRSVRFNAVRSVDIVPDKQKPSEMVLKIMSEDDLVYFKSSEVDVEVMQSLLGAILEAREQGLTKEVDSFLIVEDMADEAKLAYLEVIIHMTAQDDGVIDRKELAELQVLMQQLSFSAALRQRARGTGPSPSLLAALMSCWRPLTRPCHRGQ